MPGLGELKLTPDERDTLAKACPYFPDSYLDFLAQLRLHPKEQVRMEFVPKGRDEKLGEMGEIECWIEGVWTECIMYEVPIMSICEPGPFGETMYVLTRSERGLLQVRRYGLDLRWTAR